MSTPAQWQIDLLLKKFFEDWQPRCFVVPREENKVALLDLGLTPNQRKEIILGLKSSDYYSGPEQERDPGSHGKGDIWTFGVISNGVNIYIKLKTRKLNNTQVMAKCLSFHRATWPIRLPYKENN